MAIGSVNYSSPVMVNGYSCANCTDVDYAAKYIDPSHPQSGPNNLNAAFDASRTSTDPEKVAAAKKAADAAHAHVVGYSRAGARHAPVAAGAAFSLAA